MARRYNNKNNSSGMINKKVIAISVVFVVLVICLLKFCFSSVFNDVLGSDNKTANALVDTTR